jgi:hypothetical protein
LVSTVTWQPKAFLVASCNSTSNVSCNSTINVYFGMLQEEYSLDTWTEYSTTRFKRHLLLDHALAVVLHAMPDLPLEAEPFLLEEPAVQCCQIFLHRHYSSTFRHHILGPWRQKVWTLTL